MDTGHEKKIPLAALGESKLILPITLDYIRTWVRKLQLERVAFGMASSAWEIDAQEHVRALVPRNGLGASNGHVELLRVLNVALVHFQCFALDKMAFGSE